MHGGVMLRSMAALRPRRRGGHISSGTLHPRIKSAQVSGHLSIRRSISSTAGGLVRKMSRWPPSQVLAM